MGTPIAPSPITPTTCPTTATLLRSARPRGRSQAFRLRRPPHLHFDLPRTFPNTLSIHEHSRRGGGAASSTAPPAAASPRGHRFLRRDGSGLLGRLPLRICGRPALGGPVSLDFLP